MRFLNDLEALSRRGPAFECSECRAPILTDHVYFVDASDTCGAHPFCWTCGMSIRLHLGQITEAQFFTARQFGPL